jgi:hypothetical protein
VPCGCPHRQQYKDTASRLAEQESLHAVEVATLQQQVETAKAGTQV